MTEDAEEGTGTEGDATNEPVETDPETAEAFEEDLRQARELLDQAGVDGLYVGVVRENELDYTFAHRFDDPDRIGMQALSLLAQHVLTIAEEAGLPPGQVAEDAGTLANELQGRRLVHGEESDENVDPNGA